VSEINRLVTERIGIIVTRGIDGYPGYLIDQDKLKFSEIAIELLLSINSRIESEEIVTLSPLRDQLISGVFVLGIDQELAIALFKSVAESLYREIDESGYKDPRVLREFKKYESLLEENISDVNLLLGDNISEFLGTIDQYADSEKLINLGTTRSRLLKINRPENSSFFRPSRLKRSYEAVFTEKVKQVKKAISDSAVDINSIISDSKIDVEPPSEVETDLLTATFAGEGKKIYSSISDLYEFYLRFGSYQGSLASSITYYSMYYEYMMAMCYGKNLPLGVLSSEFGNFQSIYKQKTLESRIAGLKFLEPIFSTRSGNQNTTNINPVAKKFANGIDNRYVYEFEPNSDFLSLSLESLYLSCLQVGDYIRSILNRPPGGIGDVKIHLDLLSKVFPKSSDIRERYTGITGSVKELLDSNKSLYALLGYSPDLSLYGEQFQVLSEKVNEISSVLRSVGFKPGEYVPSLELTYYEPDKKEIEKNLRRIGFNNTEIQDILSVSSFSELVDKFAPLTDSSDVISFFRAYDLTKLLYEYGGQEAIDRYINYLYGVDDNESILRFLKFLEINKSQASKFTESQYSKLIGYLIPLTYSINPDQLVYYDSILKGNNLNLFESITFLFENGIENIIKDKSEISLLSGMISQMVTMPADVYESEKSLWNDLISKSSGNVGKDISGLYERAEGIIPNELYSALNNPSPYSPLGQILNGVKGGRMTSLLRYCSVFGLLYTLSSYRNSGQLVNKSAENFTLILDLTDQLERLSEILKLSALIFNRSKDHSTSDLSPYRDLINVQNKKFSGFVGLINNSDVRSISIAESPGIGNSRIANGLRVANSLSPEEAALVSELGQSIGSFTSRVGVASEGSNYIRIATENLLANGVLVRKNEPEPVNFSNTASSVFSDYTTTYRVTQGGDNSPRSNFDPVESCRRFGGTQCEELGYDTDSLCSKSFNKSLFPETGYGNETPIFSPGSVPVDRPLGSALSRNVIFNKIRDSDPQRYFSSSGLSEASRSNLLKENEMLCASIKDPMEYGACISMLKCKRFDPPYEGKYWLEFCPSTLHGGRLRK